MDPISYVLGILSMCFYGITYFPQFYEMYKKKSSEGVSIWAVLLWAQADALSLTGSILLQLNIMIIVLCWYHFFMDLVFIVLFLFYQTREFLAKISSYLFVFASVNVILNITIQIIFYSSNDANINMVGEVLAWVTMAIYLLGRVPQILHLQKTIEGLSILMFIFTVLGNASYLGLLFVQNDPSNLPWIVLSIALIILDMYVIFTILYKKYYRKQEISLEESNISLEESYRESNISLEESYRSNISLEESNISIEESQETIQNVD